MPQTKVISLYPDREKSPVSTDSQQKKPWERQPHEPASLFLRFTAYRLLGRKRSLQALVDSDRQEQEAIKSPKKKSQAESSQLREVKSIPGSIKAASKKWRWVERAAAWDLDQIRRKEAFWDLVLKDGSVEYAEAGRRINLLSNYVCCLEKHIEKNPEISFERQMECFKMISQLLRQIEHEMTTRSLLMKA